MNDQYINFPCTKKCLVFASCNRVCRLYIDYVQNLFQSTKYRCFKVIPDPPQNIQELVEVLDRVEDDKYMFTYYPETDISIISLKKPTTKTVSIIRDVRKIKTLKYHKHFPKDFR